MEDRNEEKGSGMKESREEERKEEWERGKGRWDRRKE